MSTRARPPADISPTEFFTRWVPATVEADADRRSRLGDTRARIVFEVSGDGGGQFTISIANGVVSGAPGPEADPDLRVRVDLATWRLLNSGALSPPEAVLKRRLKMEGDFILGLKLHVILG